MIAAILSTPGFLSIPTLKQRGGGCHLWTFLIERLLPVTSRWESISGHVTSFEAPVFRYSPLSRVLINFSPPQDCLSQLLKALDWLSIGRQDSQRCNEYASLVSSLRSLNSEAGGFLFNDRLAFDQMKSLAKDDMQKYKMMDKNSKHNKILIPRLLLWGFKPNFIACATEVCGLGSHMGFLCQRWQRLLFVSKTYHRSIFQETSVFVAHQVLKQEPARAVNLVDFDYLSDFDGVRPRLKRAMPPPASDKELEGLFEEGSKLKELEASFPPVDAAKARFPYCLVWTPLPVISWLAPFVGHVGICREDGAILDFAGPFFVNVDNFAFGATARYVRLDTDKCCFPAHLSAHKCENGFAHAELGTGISWDDALRMGTQNYQHKSYNLFTCNCHSFAASCMNRLAYGRSIRWNVVDIAVLIFMRGQWVNFGAILRSFGPFLVVMAVGLLMAGWPFLVGWAAFSTLLLAWFVIATYFMGGVIHC